MSLDGVLYRLLFQRSYRDAFLRGDIEALGLSPSDVSAFSTVDRGELARAARLACDGILRRSHRGTGSLLDAFAQTIGAWRHAHPNHSLEDLADELTQSLHFERYRVQPCGSGGLSLQEVFFRFAEDAEIGDAPTRKAECARALLKTLVVTPAPTLALPPFIFRAPKGHFAILEEGEPTLMAAVEGRFVTGPITRFLAELLISGESPSHVAERFGVDAAVLDASCDELRRLGLFA